MRYKLLIFILAICLILPVSSWASTQLAASCALSDVIAAYNKASSGDIVTVPAGNCTWSSTLNITKSITLSGAGMGSTIINHGYGGNLIVVNPSSDVAIRITGFYFKSTTNLSGYTTIYINGSLNGSHNLSQIRIDNNKIEKGTRALYVHGWVEGVADHNTFVNNNIAVGFTGDDNYSWNRPITAGTSHAMFIEDNTFIIDNNADQEPNQLVYHQEGARSVIRHNLFDGTAYTNGNTLTYDSHGNLNYYSGNNAQDMRGQPIQEVYSNTFHAHHTYEFMDNRGGSALIYNNAFITDSGSCPILPFTEEESWQTGFGPLATVWPAEDQIMNTFVWGNTFNGAAQTDGVVYAQHTQDATLIQKNRDYFMHAPQSSGGSESYPDRAGAANMTFTSSGPNAYYPYTGYTYPHPLVSGTDKRPSPPMNVQTK